VFRHHRARLVVKAGDRQQKKKKKKNGIRAGKGRRERERERAYLARGRRGAQAGKDTGSSGPPPRPTVTPDSSALFTRAEKTLSKWHDPRRKATEAERSANTVEEEASEKQAVDLGEPRVHADGGNEEVMEIHEHGAPLKQEHRTAETRHPAGLTLRQSEKEKETTANKNSQDESDERTPAISIVLRQTMAWMRNP
jgi:hypothetical protein